MRKPTEPSRPVRPSQKAYFKNYRRKVTQIHVPNTTGYQSHMPAKQMLDYLQKVSPELLEKAEIRAPYTGGKRTWSIRIELERSDEQLQQMYDEAIDQYEKQMHIYREALAAYREDIEAWKNWELKKVQEKYAKEIAKIERAK